jgi:hypothetical protein
MLLSKCLETCHGYSVAADAAFKGLGLVRDMNEYGILWLNLESDWDKFELVGDSKHFLLSHYEMSLGSQFSRAIMPPPTYEVELQRRLAVFTTSKSLSHLSKQIFRAVRLELAILCIHQYRYEALAKVVEYDFPKMKPLNQDFVNRMVWSKDGLENLYQPDRWHLVSSKGQTKAKTPQDIVQWLWGESASFKRARFFDATFRKMQFSVRRLVESLGASEVLSWDKFFLRTIFLYNRVLPYPCGYQGSLISKGSSTYHQGRRTWWACEWREGSWQQVPNRSTTLMINLSVLPDPIGQANFESLILGV